MFSTSMMESSTTSPSAIASPPRVMVLMVMPNFSITITAVIVMEKFGITINTITLGGLAIALGEVVDDSIIDVENIFRRLRENKTVAQPRSIFQVVLGASLEVRRAVVFATFIVALIFLPVLTLTGLQGSFFAPLALSYILAILASLLVALTVTPALS